MKAYYFFLLMICVMNLRGQDRQEIATRIVEDLVGTQDENYDYETVYENILQILSNPVNLNTADKEELRQLRILNEIQIQEIIDYRNSSGNFLSIYELQSLKSFDQNTARRLSQLILIKDPSEDLNKNIFTRVSDQGNHYFMSRVETTLEHKAGFTSTVDSLTKFSGSPFKVYSRFRSNKTRDYSIGFTGEKDAGEQFIFNRSKRQFGFDFLSYHVQLQNKGRIKNIVIGDYQAQFGQGLIFGGGFGLGKGGETVTTARRTNLGILPYTSVNESGFFRGAALTYKLSNNISATMLMSSIRRDATDNSDGETNAVSSFQVSGLHRNSNEFENRKNVTEKNYGAIIRYAKHDLDAGLIFHKIEFSQPIIKKPTPYNQFAFSGTEQRSAGFFLNYQIQNFNFFGEFAKNYGAGSGAVAGVLTSLHRQVDACLLIRSYEKNYHSFYSNAFAESSQAQNETGMYWGLKYQLSKQFSLSGYSDLFRFPWLGFRRYSPSIGYEFLFRLNYQPNKKTTMSVQFRQESKERNNTNAAIYSVSEGVKKNVWIKLSYAASASLSMKSQLQWNSYSINGATTKGLVLIQDVSYTIGKFQITARHGIFDSENFDNRTYAYENDAFMAFSIPAYNGLGIRNYVLLEYKVSRRLSVWIRYARTQYSGVSEIADGVEKINGNIKKDVKFQALIRL
jgi:hypothetical protein